LGLGVFKIKWTHRWYLLVDVVEETVHPSFKSDVIVASRSSKEAPPYP